MKRLTRRRLLEIVGVTGGAVALRSLAWPTEARAAVSHGQLFLSVYFNGGWDQLLAFDPRPNDVFTAAQAASTRILPAYQMVTDSQVVSVLASNPSGVQTEGNLSFGPAVPQALRQHAADVSLVRGMTMDTLTHEVGRRYFLTGKFPRGLAASGSSISTLVAAGAPSGHDRDLPNLSISSESYNEGQPAYASAVQVSNASGVQNVLRPLGTSLSADADAALREYERSDQCTGHALDGQGLLTTFRESREKARTMTQAGSFNLFNFTLNAASQPPEVGQLFGLMQISTSGDLLGPKGRAALAAQALARGVSQAVSVELVSGLDDHFNWDIEHAPTLRSGFEALGLLIGALKALPAPSGLTGRVWDHTTLVVFSEFSRTPLLNGRDGRDHHLTNSCLVAGPGLWGNRVIGASSDVGMASQKLNFDTGLVDSNGQPLRPTDVQATLLQSMGLDVGPISNQSPRLIRALLR